MRAALIAAILALTACDDDIVTPEPSDRFVLDVGSDDADPDDAAALRVVCVCPPPVHCLPCPVCQPPADDWIYTTPVGLTCRRCPDSPRDNCGSAAWAVDTCP